MPTSITIEFELCVDDTYKTRHMMKCVIVLMNSGIPDIVFMSADAKFIRHANEVAIAKNLVQENEVSWQKLDLNIATQFFSPIVASYNLLSCKLDNGYSCIICEDDSIFVFKEVGDHLYIAFSDDSKESEDFLSRKLAVLNKFVGLHFGPVVEELRPDNISERADKWANLGSMLDTWQQLYNQEQCFLFEAIERLQVNQNVNEMCINLLESTLKKMRSTGEKHVVHTMLIVNSKLLTLFSNRYANELQPSDILLLTVLACDIYPSMETLEDMLSQTYLTAKRCEPAIPELLSNECMMENRGQKCSDDFASGEGEDFHTPNSSNNNTPEQCTTPVEATASPEIRLYTSSPNERSFSTHILEADDQGMDTICKSIETFPNVSGTNFQKSLDIPEQLSTELESSDCFFTPQNDKTVDLVAIFDEKNKISEIDVSEDEMVIEDSVSMFPQDSVFPFVSLEPTKPRKFPRNEALQIPVFLRGHMCQYTPHLAQFIPILQGITMLVISEVQSVLASFLCRALDALEPLDPDKVERQTRVTLKRAVDELDTCIKRIREFLQKSKGVLHRQFNSLSVCWDNCRKFGLFQYSDSGIPEPMTPRLESAVSELKRILRIIFRIRYLSPRKQYRPGYDKTMKIINKHVSDCLSLYQQYLTVKAQRNITMTTYLERFPGLVHFIYIDRSADLITAPAVNVTKSTGSDGRDASLLIHDKVWSMTDKVHKFIKEGYISVMYREGDFLYSYFLWFEDTSGSSLECREPPIIDKNSPPPGIIASDFYKNLVESCFPNLRPGLVQCYELLCIHLGVVPTQFVLAQSQKLALWLWETGDIQKPIPLL